MLRFDFLERLGVTVAAFSERADGDCGAHGSGRRPFCVSCGVAATDVVRGRQVHGVSVVCVREEDRGRGSTEDAPPIPETDALVTNVHGIALAVLVADCVPIYFYDPKRRVIGMVHAGREGTFGDIVGETVRVMEREYRTSPENLHAFIGPSAGPCCYEVSSEMAEQWHRKGLPATGRHLDLWEANALQLANAGVRRERINVSGLCTICSRRFFSHRAHADGARNMALIML
jgi:polyphenol oxidase